MSGDPAKGAPADYTTTVNPRTSWGTWEGWGTSLCWWGKAYGDRDDLADIMFTMTSVSYNGSILPGLGLNIVRYNAGACSWNSINGESMVAPNIWPTRQMEGYWLDWFSTDPSSSSWNWYVDSAQRNLLWKARDRGANWFELFSNSPMWWMCYNHDPAGNADGSSDNLQSWNYDQHAVYLATIAKYAHDYWGFSFQYVEPFNEPMSDWWTASGSQEGCHFEVSTQSTVIDYLRTELDQRGLTDTQIAASDENNYDLARSTFNSLASSARGKVDKVNVHGYQYGGGRRDLLYNDVHAAGKKLWNSEYGENDVTGLSLTKNLNLDFQWLHNTAWVYWQAVDGGGWGLIQADEPARTTGAVNTKYYVLAQYTRHIRPGMTIVDSGDGNTIAAYDSGAHSLILVTTNYSTAQRITFDLSAFSVADGPVTRWATRFDGSELYGWHTDMSIVDRRFSCAFPANTVQTFQIDNVWL